MLRVDTRKALPQDRDAMFAIHEALFRTDIERIWGWDDESQLRNFLQEWNEVETHAIDIEGRLAGYIQKKIHPDHIYLLNLAVVPIFQSQGIGSKILADLKEEADDRHMELRLNVFKTNERAISFYLRHGFQTGESTDAGVKLHWFPQP